MDRRIVLHWTGLGAAVLGVLWGGASARAQIRLDLNLGRHPGASIRFGSVPPPVVVPPPAVWVPPPVAPAVQVVPPPVRPAVPVVPPTTVRYEHAHDRYGRPVLTASP